LDARMDPVPVGVAGEIWVGGAALSRGYWANTEETLHAYVADPFSQTPGQRIYRTGDRAKYRTNGEIDYLGRSDTQVKLRGYRIELPEIEAALRGHKEISEAVVDIREHDVSGAVLVAYIVTRPNAQCSHDDIRRFAAERLPEYMTPAAFVTLPAIPLMFNGKMNRQALRELWVESKQAEYVEPRTPTEQLIADIFAEVLNLDRLSINASFFGLGGHSLSATRAVLRIREVFNLDLPLLSVFRAPTVADLAISLETFGSMHSIDVSQIAEVRMTLSALSDEEARNVLTEKLELPGT